MGRVQYIYSKYIYIYIYYSRVDRPPARRVVHRRPFFRLQIIGLLCGAGVEPPRGRGRTSGARESQLFWGYIVTKIFLKIHLDITFTTEENDVIRILRMSFVLKVVFVIWLANGIVAD